MGIAYIKLNLHSILFYSILKILNKIILKAHRLIIIYLWKPAISIAMNMEKA